MRKAEARKITAPTVTAEDARANRELWRNIEIGIRRAEMFKAGLWENAPKDWDADSAIRIGQRSARYGQQEFGRVVISREPRGN